MEQFLASCWVKDDEITTRIKQVVACPGDHGDHPLYELEGGERQRFYPWCRFESLHDTREAAELWIANRLEGFCAGDPPQGRGVAARGCRAGGGRPDHGGGVMIRDTYRAFLALAVGLVLVERVKPGAWMPLAGPQAAVQPASLPQHPAAVPASWGPPSPPAWQPVQTPIVVTSVQTAPERPLARFGGAVVELAESVLGVVR